MSSKLKVFGKVVAVLAMCAGSFFLGFKVCQTYSMSNCVDGTKGGLALYTDQKTGCQYVAPYGSFGKNITPRLDKEGKAICNEAGRKN